MAERQGQTAARNMLGQRQRFSDVPFFWSQHYDVPIDYIGHAEKWDNVEIEGDIKERDCLVRYRRNGRCWRLPRFSAISTISRRKRRWSSSRSSYHTTAARSGVGYHCCAPLLPFYLSRAFEIAIFARVGHDQRRGKADGDHPGNVPGEPWLMTRRLEPQRHIFRRAAEQCIGHRIGEAHPERAHFGREQLRFHHAADRGVEACDDEREQ